MIALYLVAAVAVFAVARALIEKNTGRKLPYVNVMNFAVACTLVLLLDHPLSPLLRQPTSSAPRLRRTQLRAPMQEG